MSRKRTLDFAWNARGVGFGRERREGNVGFDEQICPSVIGERIDDANAVVVFVEPCRLDFGNPWPRCRKDKSDLSAFVGGHAVDERWYGMFERLDIVHAPHIPDIRKNRSSIHPVDEIARKCTVKRRKFALITTCWNCLRIRIDAVSFFGIFAQFFANVYDAIGMSNHEAVSPSHEPREPRFIDSSNFECIGIDIVHERDDAASMQWARGDEKMRQKEGICRRNDDGFMTRMPSRRRTRCFQCRGKGTDRFESKRRQPRADASNSSRFEVFPIRFGRKERMDFSRDADIVEGMRKPRMGTSANRRKYFC